MAVSSRVRITRRIAASVCSVESMSNLDINLQEEVCVLAQKGEKWGFIGY
jgi:hypothetical protein